MKTKYYVARLIPIRNDSMYHYPFEFNIQLLSIGFDTEILAEKALSTQPYLENVDAHYIIQKVYEI